MNILVVDDEKEIADVIELYLQNDQYSVMKFYTGEDALKCIKNTRIDLAILDIMLPDVDGFQILKQIREKYTFPVIMLTAKTEYIDKITGLTLGADDYIPKPFNPLELVARVKAQIRRYTQYNDGGREGILLISEDCFWIVIHTNVFIMRSHLLLRLLSLIFYGFSVRTGER